MSVTIAQEDTDLTDQFERRKEEANALYGRRHFQEALRSYSDLLADLDSHLNLQQQQQQQTQKQKEKTAQDDSYLPMFRAILHLNMASCALAMRQYQDAVLHCGKVLDIEPSNVKALYRCGKAYYMLKRYAKADYYLRESLKHLTKTQSAAHHNSSSSSSSSGDVEDQISKNKQDSDRMFQGVSRMLKDIEKRRNRRWRGWLDRLEIYDDRKVPQRRSLSRWLSLSISGSVAIMVVVVLIIAYLMMRNRE